ncbi:hypothetical protein MKX07_005915 [Trichoderma sp. CBMAI-0711]|nr:hypothetical protein MKX07_005915 [Trichoderma sp. CBMAI-0711]
MGHFISYVTRRPTVSPLLQLPTEILLLIASQLSSSPESLVALSLTCKTLSSILERDAAILPEASKHRLLLLLEKDLGDAFFYCSFCCRLHQYSQQWHPKVLGALRPSRRCFLYHEKKMFHPTPDSYQFALYYIYGRLVMNRHFYGFPKGLPLERLECSTLVPSWDGGPLWQENHFAKIIDDELFICTTHTIAGSAATLRDAIDEGRHGVCMHTATDPVDLYFSHRNRLYRMPEFLEPEDDKAHGSPPPFRACRDVLGACTVCLTDYVTTIERAEVNEITKSNYGLSLIDAAYGRVLSARLGEQISVGPLVDGWSITITAYHQLGRCRSPEDWKWVTLTDTPIDRVLSKSPDQPRRDMAVFPPGAIRDMWQNEGSSTRGKGADNDDS